MTRYIEAGPHIGINPQAEYYGYKQNRGSYKIEEEIGEHDPQFSFKEQLRILADRFQGEELVVVEGGCGYAGILHGIKRDALELGITVATTGINSNHEIFKDREHMPNVDEIILGKVEDAYGKGLLPPESAHLIVDVRGAFYSDTGREGSPTGTTILPIYAQLLKPGGRALLYAGEFDVGATWRGSRDSVAETDKNFGRLLIENNLGLVWQMGTRGMYGLVEKRGAQTS